MTLGAAVSASGLSFPAGSSTITGGTGSNVLTLTGGTGQIDVASSATISAVISSSSGITKTSAGPLSLTSATSGTNATTLNVSQGSLTISASQLWQTINVGSAGTLTMTGSSAALTVSGGITIDGYFDHEAGGLEASSLTVDSTGTFHDAGGSIAGSVGDISISNSGLFESVTDQSLAGATGSFVNAGTFKVDNTSGSGTTTLSMSFTNINGTIDVTGGTLSIPGSFAVGNYTTLTVNGAGTLTVSPFTDLLGTIDQTAGTFNVTGQFNIGNNGTSGAAYVLSGGTLNVQTFYVGCFSTASFLQTGGTLTAHHTEVGSFGYGTLTQTGGNSYYWDMYVGFYGNGAWTVSGGTANMVSVVAGQYGTGVINLSGSASMSASQGETLGQGGGGGTFNQSGTSTNTTPFLTDGNYWASGTYNLLGGTLSANWEDIGEYGDHGGTGSFFQSGGTNACWYEFIGSGAGTANGLYNMSGGVFIDAITFQVAADGSTGTFIQSGGSSILQAGLLEGINGGLGSMSLSGGSMSVAMK